VFLKSCRQDKVVLKSNGQNNKVFSKKLFESFLDVSTAGHYSQGHSPSQFLLSTLVGDSPGLASIKSPSLYTLSVSFMSFIETLERLILRKYLR
jgi:hypothetical protein